MWLGSHASGRWLGLCEPTPRLVEDGTGLQLTRDRVLWNKSPEYRGRSNHSRGWEDGGSRDAGDQDGVGVARVTVNRTVPAGARHRGTGLVEDVGGVPAALVFPEDPSDDDQGTAPPGAPSAAVSR